MEEKKERMGIIYKVTNKENGKIYVGQTVRSLKDRIQRHYKDGKSNSKTTTYFDRAMAKYGIEAFEIEVVEECPQSELDEKEKHYIKFFHSFQKEGGYNLTRGGRGAIPINKPKIDEEEIIRLYKEKKTIEAVIPLVNLSRYTIRDILEKHNIEVAGHIQEYLPMAHEKWEKEGKTVYYKPVRIIELDKVFPSRLDCAQWLVDNGYSKKSKNVKYMAHVIGDIINGIKKDMSTYLGFHYENVEGGELVAGNSKDSPLSYQHSYSISD